MKCEEVYITKIYHPVEDFVSLSLKKIAIEKIEFSLKINFLYSLIPRCIKIRSVTQGTKSFEEIKKN